MIEKSEPELIDDSFLPSFQNNIITVQDKLNINADNQKILNNIVQMNLDYINKNNNLFFNKLEKQYIKNILLKNKLNEIMNEKKVLNHLIIKLENKMKNSKKKNNGNIISNENNSLNLVLYKKKKRKRRKKSEIKNIFSCSFNNCNKKYPSKSSLNMHIKLKHQKEKKYNFAHEDKKSKK